MLTTCVKGEAFEAGYVESPAYCAVMLREPMLEYVRTQVAVYGAVAVSDRVVQPLIELPSSRNLTVPDGVPLGATETVAVYVIDCPTLPGFADEPRDVDEVAVATVATALAALAAPRQLFRVGTTLYW